jgi:hypothetical protein
MQQAMAASQVGGRQVPRAPPRHGADRHSRRALGRSVSSIIIVGVRVAPCSVQGADGAAARRCTSLTMKGSTTWASDQPAGASHQFRL